MKKLAFLCTIFLVVFCSIGCSSRNLRKRAVFPKAPVERTLSLSTRTVFPLAGDHPVEYGSPIVTENLLIIPSETEGLICKDRYTLNLKWRIRTKNGVNSAGLLQDNTVYFGDNDGTFYAVDADLGIIRWRYDAKVPIIAKPVIDKDKIYFQGTDDTLYCLNAETGKWLWHYKRSTVSGTTIRGNSTPLIIKDTIYSGFSDGYLVALKAKDGNILWETKLHRGAKFTDVDAEPVSDGKYLYVPSYDGGLYAVEPQNGKVIWFTDVGGSKKVLLDEQSDSRSIYLPTSDGRVLSLNRESGKVLWAFELDLGTPTNIVAHGTYLFFGGSRQYAYVIKKGDGSLVYRFNAGLRSGFFGSPVSYKDTQNTLNDEVFLFSHLGNLYGFRWKKQQSKGRGIIVSDN